MEPAEHSSSRRRYILTWCAVLPGALLCVFLVMFPIHWVVMLIQHLGTSSDDSGSGSPLSLYYYLAMLSPDELETFCNAFFTPFILIAAGANIAPKYKFPTGIVLAVSMGVVYGWTATAIAEDISDDLYTPERWLRLGITVLLCVAGVAYGLFQARNAERKLVVEALP